MGSVNRLAVSCAVLAVAGCTTVKTVDEYKGPLPRPDRVLVYDFAVSPDEVKLDRGLSARAYQALKGTPRTQQELAAGHAVAKEVSEKLIAAIRKMGLNAQRASGIEASGNDLVVTGQFISIDEGNRTERVVIGLGLGRSDVKTEVQLVQAGRVVEQLVVDAKSGRKPGMAETMGVGAATGDLAVAAVAGTGLAAGSEAFGANVEADARRTSSKLAPVLGKFFVYHGWIAEEAAK